MVGRSRGNKQIDKNAAKGKSTDSKKHKKKAERRYNLGGGQARGKSKSQRINSEKRGRAKWPRAFIVAGSMLIHYNLDF